MHTKVMKLVALAAVTALVVLFTMFIKVPTGIGYINLGDAVILFGGLLIGPMAGISAGIGSAMADILAGYPVYAPWTFLIKGLMGLFCGALLEHGHAAKRCIFVFLMTEMIMVGGYFLVEAFCLSYGVAGAAGSIVPNLVQGGAGIVCAMALRPTRKTIVRILGEK